MNLRRIARYLAIAEILAVISVFVECWGAVACAVAGVVAMMFMPRDAQRDAVIEDRDAPVDRNWLYWLFCCGCFALFAFMLAPLVSLGAYSLALILFSPLFGTSVYAIEAAYSSRFSR